MAFSIFQPEREKSGSEQVIAAIVWVDAFTAVYFTIEYVVRFTCSPRKIKFFIDPMNLVDLFAILPYFLSMVLEHLSEFHIIGKTGKVRLHFEQESLSMACACFFFGEGGCGVHEALRDAVLSAPSDAGMLRTLHGG